MQIYNFFLDYPSFCIAKLHFIAFLRKLREVKNRINIGKY
jgi:hypothetical protein